MSENISVTPSQVAHPMKATLRTTVAVLAAVLIAVPSICALVVESFGVYLSPEVITVITAISAFVVTLGGFITRLMAVPAVNEFLSSFGLGAGSPVTVVDVPEIGEEGSSFQWKDED